MEVEAQIENGSKMKGNYDNWSRKELINEIKKLRRSRKYGIVWDEENTKERFDKDTENKVPIIKEIKSKEIITDKNNSANVLIEGDNYFALSVLSFTHRGKIDVIYIDPPYNTGSTTWRYNNKYIDKEDAFKHSKWISFMHKRLKLAKDLLSLCQAL